MGKLDYLEALKRALPGLPPELQAKTLAWYEQRFDDGMAAGRHEDDIARELDDPKKVALTLRASSHMHAFAEQRNPANLLRMCVSALGLLIFNLFMVIPAAVVGSLLASLYLVAFAFYIAGIAVTASGLAGANAAVLGGPVREAIEEHAGQAGARIAFGEYRVEVLQDRPSASAGPASVRGNPSADTSLRILTGIDDASSATQTVLGLASVLGGIALFLVSLVLTRYAALGLQRYVHMNLSLLRGT